MNVLILTPDAVGSTLLQRMLTIYMQFHEFDRPVINLHELTNGLARYYSPEFNREIVSKKALAQWGYYQSLSEVVELLSSVDHYKTSRLAHYHLRRRGDSLAQQIPFYNYLNENFFVIACRRANVFEHAVSMTLNTVTKKLNVYDAWEKIDTFFDIYRSGIELDTEVFVSRLNDYRFYLEWSQQYFSIASYFNYERDIPQLEKYILNLPVFASQPRKITWESNFEISFNDWNRVHFARSNLGSLQLDHSESVTQLMLEKQDFTEDYQQRAPGHWPAVSSRRDVENLPQEIRRHWVESVINSQGIAPLLSAEKQQQLAQCNSAYQLAQNTIDQMIKLGIVISGPPIKKQTLQDKSRIVKNFDQLLEIYNNWTVRNPGIAEPIDSDHMDQHIQKETEFWDSPVRPALAQSATPPSLR